MMPSFPLSRRTRTAAVLLLALLSACAVGPDYQRPEAPPGASAPSFKEGAGWKSATPGEIDAQQPWWSSYGDPVLDQLVAQANAASPTLAQAEAQYRQAQALVQSAQAAVMPTLGLSGGSGRARTNTNGVSSLGNSHAWAGSASWEPDLWGRVSRAVEAAQAGAQASAADLAAAKLSLQAAVVNNYLQIRVDDALLERYSNSIESYAKAVQLTESQRHWGVASNADVALAEATLQSARAQAKDIGLARKQLEHALAVLLGKTPSEFALPVLANAQAGLPGVPVIPEVMPSALLERRPDIASAERRVALANANIGVAKAAWFPNLFLSASGGNSGRGLGDWLATPYRVWALGAQVAATLYDGGLRSAQDKQVLAAFDAAAAGYRQTVLAGFQEVEDNLAALSDLAVERQYLNAAVTSARAAERVLLSQYRAGTATYTAVITVQQLTLTNERAALQVQGRQLAASVALIKATGGGWSSPHN